MLARAKSRAEAAAAAARVAAAGWDERHKVGEKAAAAKAVAAAKASAAAGAAKDAKELVATRASELISHGPSSPSLGVIVVATQDSSERASLGRFVRSSRETYLGGRYDLVSCASVAEAKALLLGAPTLRAIIVRVDLPGTNNPAALAAETHGELLLSNDVSNYAATVRHEVPTHVTTGSESTTATATATETICGVEVGGLALLRWCKLQPALAEVPFAVMLPPPVDPLTNPLIDGVLISFDAPLDADRVIAALSDASSAADFVWKHATTEAQVTSLIHLLGERERQRRQISRQKFPERVKLKIWACTFNVACESFSEFSDSEAQLEALVPSGYDIYLLALQEGVGDHFTLTVHDFLRRKNGCIMLSGQGRNGPRIEGRGDGSMLLSKYTGLVAYAREDLVNDGHVQILRTAIHAFEGKGLTVKDVKESLGSKGGVAILLRCFDTTMVAISVHLAKEWHKVERKRHQYRELAAQLGAKLGHPDFQLHSQFHHVIWMGDFNYHIDEAEVSPADCVAAISSGKAWERLGKHDEMSREIAVGQAYVGFNEPQKTLDFYPSYKKKVPREKSDYTTGEAWVDACYDVNFKQQWYKGGKIKLRMPSWTDRVLWYSQPHLAAAQRLVPMTDDQDLLNVGAPLYRAVNDWLLHSDHSPVHASFALTAANQCRGDAQRQFLYEVEIGEQVRVYKQGDSEDSRSPIHVEALVPAPFEIGQAHVRPTREKLRKKEKVAQSTVAQSASGVCNALEIAGIATADASLVERAAAQGRDFDLLGVSEVAIETSPVGDTTSAKAVGISVSGMPAAKPAAEFNLLGIPMMGQGLENAADDAISSSVDESGVLPVSADGASSDGSASSAVAKLPVSNFDTTSRLDFTLTRGKLGFGMTITEEGVVKGYVKPDPGDVAGPAQQLGVPIGSRITSVQGQPVYSKVDIHKRLHQVATEAAAATAELGKNSAIGATTAAPAITFSCHINGLTPIEKIRRVFDAFDTDCDDLLCQEELQALAVATGDAIVEGVYEMICSKVGRDPSRGLSVDDLIRVYCYFDLGEIDRDFAALGLGPPASEVIQQAVEAARAANRSASDARRLIYTFSASEQAEHTACVRATTADGESGEAAVPLRFPPIASSLRVPFVPEADGDAYEEHTEEVTAILMRHGVVLRTSDGSAKCISLSITVRRLRSH